MSKTQYLCATSAAVLLAASAGLTEAHAQGAPAKAPAPPTNTEVTEVVVTGSFIAGTPEDAAMPVEAVTLEELRQQGSPSNLDLVKSLSEIGSVAGEANRLNAFAIGAQSVNLRSLSSSRTVVVFNGRRLLEQYSASVGRFNNVALIPNAAIGRVEVLKDGGATTYGADAVGGVVNYITRKNLDGVEANVNYRYIRDSRGNDYDADISAGKVGENWNVMLVAGYIKRNEVDLKSRDWWNQPYLMNPSSWNGQGSPGAYTFQRATGQTITPGATVASGNRFGGDVQMGITGVTRDPFCSAVGGFAGWSATPSPLCYFQFGNLSHAVEETTTYQGYGEFNYKFDNSVKFHAEAVLYKLDVPHTPIDNGGGIINNFPILPGSPTGATQTIGTAAYAVPGTNPAVRQQLLVTKNSDGSPAFGDPNTPGTLAFQIINSGRVGLNTGTWKPFAYGANPYPEGDQQHNYSTTWRVTAEFSGDLPEFLGFNLKWDGAATYNDLKYDLAWQDMLVDRLQAALNGLGGPGCTGTTPGANGCQYFNPFSSAIDRSITGQVNPGYVGVGNFTGYTPGQGLANNRDLVKWLYVPGHLTRKGQYIILDALISGSTPLKLWADDPVQIAFGGQYRRYHEKIDLDDLSDRAITPCATPGVTTCVTKTGPGVFGRGINVTGLTLEYNRKYPVASAFFEVQAPILNNLTANISGRYEKFYSDVTDVNNDVFVPAGSVKWQVTDWLALRATAGKSFSQVNPPQDQGPIKAANVSAPTALGGTAVQFNSNNFPNLGVKPERGFNYNVGTIVQHGGFRATIDYYDIKIKDIIRAGATGQLVNALVQPGATGATALINCSSPLLSQTVQYFAGQPTIILNGPCVQGQSALNSTGAAGGPGGLAGGTVNFFGGQGTQPALINGGTLETAGIDATISYRFEEIFGGQLTTTLDVTRVTKYHQSDYLVNGIKVADGYDGIDQFNELTGRNGQHVARTRGSITFNYRYGRHNLNVSTRYISHFVDDDTTNYVEATTNNANIGNANGVVPGGAACVDTNPTSPPVPAGAGTGQFGTNSGTNIGFCAGQNTTILAGQKVPATFLTDVSYNVQLPWDTTFTLTIQNVFDKDPEFSRDAINYDAFTGSPLGRTFRVGVRKRF